MICAQLSKLYNKVMISEQIGASLKNKLLDLSQYILNRMFSIKYRIV